MKNILLALLIAFTFNACGGGDSDTTVSTDTRSKSMTIDWDFTSSNTITTDSSYAISISVNESVINLAHITSDYTVVLGGEDALLFSLNSTSSGQSLVFNQATNFYIPVDVGQDNSYKIELSLESEAQSSMVFAVTFNIQELVSLTNYSQVSKTGQIVSDNDFDDAYYSKGIDKNLTRSSEMVTDHISGLIWQDNNESNSTGNAVDFTSGVTYCNNLSLGGLTWRVPSVRELQSMTNYSTTQTVKVDPIFVYTNSVYKYMSSDDYNSTHSYRYNHGIAISEVDADTAGALIRCVSGTNDSVVLAGDLSRNSADEIVIDSKNNLMWQDDASVSTTTGNWLDAINTCNALDTGGYVDWRLPQIFELVTLIDATSIHTTYQNDAANVYWSSTSNPTDRLYASTINTSSSSIFEGSGKGAMNYTRCVRDFQ